MKTDGGTPKYLRDAIRNGLIDIGVEPSDASIDKMLYHAEEYLAQRFAAAYMMASFVKSEDACIDLLKKVWDKVKDRGGRYVD